MTVVLAAGALVAAGAARVRRPSGRCAAWRRPTRSRRREPPDPEATELRRASTRRPGWRGRCPRTPTGNGRCSRRGRPATRSSSAGTASRSSPAEAGVGAAGRGRRRRSSRCGCSRPVDADTDAVVPARRCSTARPGSRTTSSTSPRGTRRWQAWTTIHARAGSTGPGAAGERPGRRRGGRPGAPGMAQRRGRWSLDLIWCSPCFDFEPDPVRSSLAGRPARGGQPRCWCDALAAEEPVLGCGRSTSRSRCAPPARTPGSRSGAGADPEHQVARHPDAALRGPPRRARRPAARSNGTAYDASTTRARGGAARRRTCSRVLAEAPGGG